MLNSPKVHVLRDSLARALVASDPNGWPPERAIVAVKEIANEAGLMQTRNVLSLNNRDLDRRDALMVRVVRWCIECYYDVQQYA